MKNLIVLLMAMAFVLCGKNDTPDNPEKIKSYCEQLFDTTGLKLYQFTPFTDEWGPGKTPFNELADSRQIPEDFLHGMTTEELFLQYFYCELDLYIAISQNNLRSGFLNSKILLNMVPELLNRPDVGQVILEILKKIDVTKLEGRCKFLYIMLFQVFAAQPEVINSMTDEEIDDYIFYQMRCHDDIQMLSQQNSSAWGYDRNVEYILFGLGNVMIRYEFEPFMQLLLEKHEDCRTDCAYCVSFYLIIDYFNDFKNREK